MGESKKQIQNLINEYKGNLFEYLCALELSRMFNIEGDFLFSLPDSYKKQLSLYEHNLRQNAPELIRLLPQLASISAQRSSPYLKKNQPAHFRLIGKVAAAAGNDTWKEADVLMQDGRGTFHPISIKLAKESAWVNTKSAGARSFIAKYFSCSQGEMLQQHLELELDELFSEMAQKLYEEANLAIAPSAHFFGSEWDEAGYSHLPGELSEDMRKIVLEFYSKIIKSIYEKIIKIQEEDKEAFKKGLYSLCGHSIHDLLQIICFYQRSYELSRILIRTEEETKKNIEGEFQIENLNPNLSSFEIKFTDFILQIRVKPMNNFTVPALKINCSLKYLCK